MIAGHRSCGGVYQCEQGWECLRAENPGRGLLSFDNIFTSALAIFQVRVRVKGDGDGDGDTVTVTR